MAQAEGLSRTERTRPDHTALKRELAEYFPPSRLKTRPIDLYAYASDASFYYLVPAVVVMPASLQEVQWLMETARRHHISITFRTAGTSLSGQSVTDGILADLSRHWAKASVEKQGQEVTVQPGITGSMVNLLLKPYKRKIGPDPASINAAMMGGILSNNSSGMCCGVTDNSYHTLQSIRFLLTNGKSYWTKDPADYDRFRQESAALFDGLARLRNSVLENTELVGKIRRKYKIKNTVGYGLNAFIDYEHPLDILAHLLIGAEGTLGFIVEATLRTIPDNPFKKTGLLFFDSPRAACDAIPALVKSGAVALEFMDRPALRSIEHLSEAPSFLRLLPGDTACILCEYQADTASALEEMFDRAKDCLAGLPLTQTTEFTTDPAVQAAYWKLRKGMYPSVAAVRAKGTSVMLEDVAVPLERLGDAIVDLQQLFRKYEYHNAIVFGHAREGNLHFLISQSIATQEDIQVFEAFNDDLAALITRKYQGSLKAEHGTGRQIAPYVQDEWGDEAYAVMEAVKNLLDPDNTLNPGVIITADKKIHLRNLKSLPVVEEEVDKCVECGYCEQRCPSKDFTLTPRQRIVLRRAMSRLESEGDHATYKSILRDYQFAGMDTCAVDGLCATECPVEINTGELVKRLRRENHSKTARSIALRIARSFALVEATLKTGIRAGQFFNRLFGARTMNRFTLLVRKLIPAFPLWHMQLTRPVSVKGKSTPDPDAIYFTCCMNRMMGADIERKESIVDVLMNLARKAGIKVAVPDNLTGHCCGQAFASKGFPEAYRYAANKTVSALWEWTDGGKRPVVLDITSCTMSLQHSRAALTPENKTKFDQLQILDSIDFAADHLLPRLTILERKKQVVLHPVCSLQKMKMTPKLKQIAEQAALYVTLPVHTGCCGMAGDRGFYYPGLIEAATGRESKEVKSSHCNDCYSTGKPCEMAMSEATGRNYRSIWYLLDDVSAETNPG